MQETLKFGHIAYLSYSQTFKVDDYCFKGRMDWLLHSFSSYLQSQFIVRHLLRVNPSVPR